MKILISNSNMEMMDGGTIVFIGLTVKENVYQLKEEMNKNTQLRKKCLNIGKPTRYEIILYIIINNL